MRVPQWSDGSQRKTFGGQRPLGPQEHGLASLGQKWGLEPLGFLLPGEWPETPGWAGIGPQTMGSVDYL